MPKTRSIDFRVRPRTPVHPSFAGRFLLGLLVFLIVDVTQAATFTVNSRDDDSDNNPGDGSCFTGTFIVVGNPPVFAAECTLRAALEEANGLGGHDVVEFSGSLPQVATVVEFFPATSLPIIYDPVTIDGYSHPDYDGAATAPIPVIQIGGSSTPDGTNGLAFIPGSDGSIVRGLAIMNFPESGILLSPFFSPGPQNIRIEGNHLGISRGVFYVGNEMDGIRIVQSDGNTVGSGCTFLSGCLGRRNVIAANGRSGVRIENSDGTRVAGNYIGVDRYGSATFVPFGGSTPNAEYGVHVLEGSNENEIGDVGAVYDFFQGILVPVSAGNVISGNLLGGIRIEDENNFVWANLVGTNASGTAALANQGPGIQIRASNNTIGDVGLNSNLVSGNSGTGISVDDLGPVINNVTVAGNRVGVNLSGDAAIPNNVGISIGGNNHVVRDNFVAGNASHGIAVAGAGSDVLGNRVGTDGQLDLGNGGAGIRIRDGQLDLGLPGQGNLIGFNAQGIVTTLSSFTVRVVDNRIGVGPAGEDIGNDAEGILMAGGGHSIGEPDAIALGFANVIGNNGSAGIRLDDVGAITVESNYVGTDATDADHGNAGPGVDVADLGFGPPSWIGADVGTAPAGVVSGGNVIAYNDHGIVIELAESVSTRGNRLFANGGIAIDLADDGITDNDLGDLDLGSNRLQNKPVFDRDQTAFVVATGDLDVRYRVDASPAAVAYPLTIDFYIHDPWLEPGDQARVYIGSDTYVAAEAGAFRSTTITPLAGTLAPNVHGFVFEGLRATATDANGNTSELTMEPVPVPEPGLAGALAAGLVGLAGLGTARSRR